MTESQPSFFPEANTFPQSSGFPPKTNFGNGDLAFPQTGGFSSDGFASGSFTPSGFSSGVFPTEGAVGGYPSTAQQPFQQSLSYSTQPTGFPIKLSGFPTQSTRFPIQSTGFPTQSTGFPNQPISFPIQTTGFSSQPSSFYNTQSNSAQNNQVPDTHILYLHSSIAKAFSYGYSKLLNNYI